MILKQYRYHIVNRKFAWKPTKVLSVPRSERCNYKFDDGQIICRTVWLQFIYNPQDESEWYETEDLALSRKES